MSEIKITKDSLENAILKDGQFVSGYVSEDDGSISASGYGAHAEGYAESGSVIANGNGAHAEGINTQALRDGAHAEGFGGKGDIIKKGSDVVLFNWDADPGTSSIQATIYVSNGEDLAESILTIGDIIYYEGTGEYREIVQTSDRISFLLNKAFDTVSPLEGTRLYKFSGVACGLYSHTEGYKTTALEYASHAGGEGTIADCSCMTAIGRYNKMAGIDTVLFVVGNGTDTSSGRSNAFRVTKNGSVYGGTYNNTGADYAEYFEWSDGNPKSEDRIGHFVSIDNKGKIKIADSSKDIIGIVSGTPSVVGNSASEDWHKKYITDVFGRIQYNIDSSTGEKIPQINPEYDPNKEYISREKRKEWASVGLLGQLVVIDDGTCKVGKKCDSNEQGIATTGNSYIVLERLDSTHIKILFK